MSPPFLNIFYNFINMLLSDKYFERHYPRLRGKEFDIMTINVSKFCDKVLNLKTMKDKEKVSTLLQLDATLYTNVGSDSTKSEIQQSKKLSRVIYRSIKKLDKALGDTFLRHQDKSL